MQKIVKNIILVVSAWCATGTALAHDQNGSLGKNAKAVDYYQVQCSSDDAGNPTSYLVVSVIDKAAIKSSTVISVQVIRGLLAYSTTDNGPDGDKNYSPEIKIYGGNGSYQVLVDKNKVGADDYSLEYHCETKFNSHSGTSIVQLQNK